jgi:two-component system alkaline phosphatase synthesis response regulator PhoP
VAAKILLVEDDQILIRFLKSRLEGQGYRVATAGDGEEALRAVGRELPDAVILELALPELDGLTVCRHLRANPETARLPILVLSGKGDEVEKMLSFELGADDFITKPYNEQELFARLKAILRRTALSPPARIMRSGSMEVDLDRYVVTLGGREVKLTSKEFELLRTLMEAKGRALRREFLLEKVWGYVGGAEIESRTIDVHIRRLREKLGPEGRRILTVRNVGYRFEASVERALGSGGPF